MKSSPNQYLVEFKKGEKWQSSKSYKQQPFIGEHVQFLKKLYHDDKISFGGHLKKTQFGIYCFRIKDRETVEKILSKNLAVSNLIISYEVKPFTLTMQKVEDHSH